jgi:hypothetical protein
MHSPAKRASRSRSFSSIRALSIQWQDKVVNPVGSEGFRPARFYYDHGATHPPSGTFKFCWQMEVPKSAALESGPKFSHSLRSSEAAGQKPVFLVEAVDFLLSFGAIMLLLAMIFKFVPDTKVAWSDVWICAALASLLFTIGKALVGLYLVRSTVASAYGAAASLVILLVWVYYSAQILLLGAEVTHVYANKHGSRLG